MLLMCVPSKVLTIYYHTKAGVGGNSREVHHLPNGRFLRNKGGDLISQPSHKV
jgi:hypothetical protein